MSSAASGFKQRPTGRPEKRCSGQPLSQPKPTFGRLAFDRFVTVWRPLSLSCLVTTERDGYFGRTVFESGLAVWSKRNSSKVGWLGGAAKSSPKRCYGHNGMVRGASSFLGVIEEAEMGVVVLTNTAKSVDSLGTEILKELAGTRVRPRRISCEERSGTCSVLAVLEPPSHKVGWCCLLAIRVADPHEVGMSPGSRSTIDLQTPVTLGII